MTSLPSVILHPGGTPPVELVASALAGEDEKFLLQAFRSFAEAAGSLERSYGTLRDEVARLHGELAESNGELARSLEENREMRLRLDRILHGLPCGVLVARADGAVSLINPEGRRLLALATGGGSEFEQLGIVPGAVGKLLDRARVEGGEAEQSFAETSGGEFWLATRHAPLGERESEREQEREEDAVSIFILRDVSDARRVVREREKNRREQALAEMSAILAHEIRNPLGSLELFAGLLAEAELSPECGAWVEQVQAGLRSLAATVNNVLHFHSLPEPERGPIDLGCLLDWAEAFLLPVARQARIEVRLRNRLHGVGFAADRHRLEQVLLNLVLNALRAAPEGGWVEIAGGVSQDLAAGEISVSDSGAGIPRGQEEKIFAPGFSTRPGSPGLGLTVCKKIVEQHGGILLAANRKGAGACFTVELPLRRAGKLFNTEGTEVHRVGRKA